MADLTKKEDEGGKTSSSSSLAIFAGVAAAAVLARQGETRPRDAIRKAEEMAKSGASRKDIHAATSKMLENTPYAGVVYGRDGMPRFEIDDSGAKIKSRAAIPAGGKAFQGDVLDHPELYKAVPTAKNLTVQKSETNNSGIAANKVTIGARHFLSKPLVGREIMRESAIGPNLHELQHHVQDREPGFDPGGAPQMFESKYPGDRNRQVQAYSLLAGEQEAEMARRRQTMTAAERRAKMPVPDVPTREHLLARNYEAPLTRAKVDMTSIADAARSAWNSLVNKDMADNKPVRFRRLDPLNIKTDPETFQFKSGGDSHGVTDRLKGVTSWDPVAAGKAVVFERANGELVIADGHQRRGLAERLAREGQHVRMDAYVLRERDGWSPRDVYAYAALKNIKESSGNALDMAKVMRERPDLVNGSVPMSDAKVREARNLSRLSGDAFGMVVNGMVKPEYAAAVGEGVLDSTRHVSMLKEMAEAGIQSQSQAKLYVGQALSAPQFTETTGSLFGEETNTRSLLAERTKVLDKALGALKSDKKIFSLLEREAANIESAGNRLSHEANAARATDAGQLSALVERLATTRGPVSDMLDRAARDLVDGKTPAAAARSFVRAVGDTVKSGGIAALTGEAAPMKAEIDPNQSHMFGERQGWSDEARQASAEVRKGKGGQGMHKVFGKESPWAKDPALASAMAGAKRYGIKVPAEIKARGADAVREFTRTEAAKSRTALKDRAMIVDAASHFDDPKKERGPMSDAAKAKWEKVLGTVPVDKAEAKLAERRKAESLGKGRTRAMVDDGGKKDQSSFLPEATTKERISAAARAKEAKGRTGDPMNEGLFGSSKDQTDLVDRAKNPNSFGGENRPVPATNEEIKLVERAIKNGRGVELSTTHKDIIARASNEQVSKLDTEAGVYRRAGAATDNDFNRVSAFREAFRARAKETSDAAAKAQIEGAGNRPGWSDAAREASAEVRAATAVSPYRTLRNGDKVFTKEENARRLAEAKALPKSDPTRALKIEHAKILAGTAWRPDGSAYSPGLKNLVDDTLKADQEKAFSQTKRGARAGKKAAGVAKIKGELREMFSRSPDGKQRNTKGELLPKGNGPAGWSDAAREASAKVRSDNAKPLMKDATVKHLLKQGLVTREDVKTSGSMSDLKAKARASATQMLKDRGFDGKSGQSIYQTIDDWLQPKTRAKGKAKAAAKGSDPASQSAPIPQMTDAGRESRYINRMRAGGSQKTDAQLKAEFAQKAAASKPRGRGAKALGLLAPVAVGAAMLAASNEAKAEGLDEMGQVKAAGSAAAESGTALLAFTGGTALAVKGLMQAGLTAARATPIVQGALIAGGAAYGALTAEPGQRLKGAAKGAWDMSLPGMVVNTARDASAAVADRASLQSRGARTASFEDANSAYETAHLSSHTPSEPDASSDPNAKKGWSNSARISAYIARNPGGTNLPYGGDRGKTSEPKQSQSLSR